MTNDELQEVIDQYVSERFSEVDADELVGRIEEMSERAVRRAIGEW